MIFWGVKMHVPSDVLQGSDIPYHNVEELRLPILVQKSRSPHASPCPGGDLAWKWAGAERQVTFSQLNRSRILEKMEKRDPQEVFQAAA